MVHVGNIMKSFDKLKNGEILIIGFMSGKTITNINNNDKLEVLHGDIIFTRIIDENKYVSIIDPSKVECINISKNGGIL